MTSERQSWWRRQQPLIRWTLAIVGVVVGLVLFGWFWWQGVPALYRNAGGGPGVENARLNAVTTTRAALLAGFVGIGALGTFWLNNRVYRITARTFEVTERGQLTDRYSRAIEQLGSETLDVRLGGIYALEQIATDSPRSRDQATIVEVLSAFVRVHSDPLYQDTASHSESAQPESVREQRRKAVEHIMGGLPWPPVDVHAAVTVLSRLPIRPEVERGDLSNAWLMEISLGNKRANLTGANLIGADLTDAYLTGADLTRAFLNWADLTDAYLTGADLTGAT